jgi:hypothetical protein
MIEEKNHMLLKMNGYEDFGEKTAQFFVLFAIKIPAVSSTLTLLMSHML